MSRRLVATWTAFRAPAFLLVVGIPLVLFREVLIPNLMIIANYYTPNSNTVYRISLLRPDYLLYLPNAVVFLAYLLAAFVLLEIKQWRLPRNTSMRQDAATALIGFAVALSSQAFMNNMKPGVLQLLQCGIQVALLWLFMMGNAGLSVVYRVTTRVRWVTRLLEWTFPVSDLVCYQLHRQRLGAASRRRVIPSVCAGAMIAALLVLQGRILWTAIPAERVAVPVDDVNSSLLDDGGIWFANAYFWDSRAGIWYYDERTRRGFPVIRTYDTRRFLLHEGSFYFHDRYEHAVFKVDANTRQVLWRVPAQLSGTFELMRQGDLIYAVGEGGYILILDTQGRVRAERQFPFLTFEAQPVWGGRLAFVSGDQRIRIWDSTLTEGETLDLPLPKGVVSFAYNPRNNAGLQIVTNMTDYAEATHVFYAGTFWGEIFRYDTKNRRWLPSLHTHMGLRSISTDARNGLLFVANYFQGYIQVLDLQTGRHVAYILANDRARYIALDPVKMRGVLSTRAYGLYRFTYSEMVRRRQGSALAGRTGVATPLMP